MEGVVKSLARRLCSPATLAVLVLLAGGPAGAATLGPLEFTPGVEGDWQVGEAGGVVVLENRAVSGTSYWTWAGTEDDGTHGRRTISLEVALDKPGEGAGAGILYGMAADQSSYFVFLLFPGGRTGLYRYAGGSFTELLTFTSDTVATHAVLEIRERGGEIGLAVDGVEVGSYGGEGIGAGGVGIHVEGLGRFRLISFAVTPLPGDAIAAGPAPSPQALPVLAQPIVAPPGWSPTLPSDALCWVHIPGYPQPIGLQCSALFPNGPPAPTSPAGPAALPPAAPGNDGFIRR
jgi:hypothetical protein